MKKSYGYEKKGIGLTAEACAIKGYLIIVDFTLTFSIILLSNYFNSLCKKVFSFSSFYSFCSIFLSSAAYGHGKYNLKF